jgi:Putative transposase/Transposase zinc-binding domain
VVTPVYQPRDPSATVLYRVVANHLETFLATLAADPTAKGLPDYVTEEFDAYLQCGVLAHGFVRLGCDSCPHQMLLAFSCKKRGFCPSCAARRMAQQAAHLVEQVIPWVATRQWVVSVPIPLRYWMAPSRDLTAKVHTIIRRTIGQYYINQAVKQGATRTRVQPGSVTFLQRFGGSINLHLHFHIIFLEGVYEDRRSQGLKPRFRPQEAPRDGEIAGVLQKISQRVIRHLRQRGYLEAGIEDVVPTGYDPASDEAPELARTLAASVQQRIAFGERAGQRVRRIGSGFGDEGDSPTLTGTRCASVNGFSLHANTHVPAHRRDELERLLRYTARGAVALERLEEGADGDLLYTFSRPWSDGTTGIKLSALELLEKLAALVPLPRMHLVRYGGCLAPHSHLRAAIIPTPRQQGLEEPEGHRPSPNWTWARLLKRVFAIDMERCPVCHQGRLRIIAAITERSVIRKILQHLKLAVDPPPIAPARQAAFAWDVSSP